jgi:hypothetical protein
MVTGDLEHYGYRPEMRKMQKCRGHAGQWVVRATVLEVRLLNVRFAPKATELLRRRELQRSASSDQWHIQKERAAVLLKSNQGF